MSTPPGTIGIDAAAASPLEATVGRLITLGTYVSVLLLGIGVVAMVLGGRSPLDPAAPLDLGRLPSDLAALRAEGFLWLGLLVVIATPAARVMVALAGFVRLGERRMALVATGVLIVIALGVIVAQPPQQ